MKTTLKNLATIQSGHPFSRRIEAAENGAVSVIQMKDLPNELHLTSASPVRVDSKKIKNRYLLKTDDLIFRARGQTNTCIILKANFGMAVATAPLMTLRVTSENVLPDYLCWWINQSIAQIHFERHAKGTSVRMISREALESLEINLPPIAVQRQIVELALLGEHEQELLSRLAAAEKKKLHSILIKTATEEK